MLVGIKEAAGFSSTADEIKVGFEELMINVIKPKQEVILDSLMEIFAVNGLTLQLDFESLRAEDIVVNDAIGIDKAASDAAVSYNGAQIASAIDIFDKVKEGILTTEQAIVFLVQFLNIPASVAQALFNPQQAAAVTQLASQGFDDLGEDIDLNEWELISSEAVDYEKEEELDAELDRMNGVSTQLMSVAMASVSTGTARPNAKSYQDGALFKSRYRYSGNPSPERAFCKDMMSKNKLYRKEDIEMMSQRNVNPGFGMHPNPDQPYDIFLWKGGGLQSEAFPFGTCKHYWIRETYRKKADVNNPITQETGKITPAEARKAGEILPTNNPKAYIAPHDM